MINDFKKFIMKGNVLDLAVAVVIGAAFNAVVQSFVNNILLQFVGGLFGKPSFNDALIVKSGNKVYLSIGAFITDLINFIIIAFAVFLVVKAFETLQARRRAGAEPEPVDEVPEDVLLLREIRDSLKARP